MEEMSESKNNKAVIKECISEEEMMTVSPSYMFETSGVPSNSDQVLSQSAATSAGSAGATTATVDTSNTTSSSGYMQASQMPYANRSSTAIASGESKLSQPNNKNESQRIPEPSVMPQYSIGAQYLEPPPFIRVVNRALPSRPSSLSTLLSPAQAQMQDQLSCSQRALQQKILRQQKELRLVNERLLLARHRILQPTVNDPYVYPEQFQQNTHPSLPEQILYERAPVGSTGYPPYQQPPSTAHKKQNRRKQHRLPPQ